MSLRSWLAATMGVLTLMTLAVATLLIVLTSVLDRSAATLGVAVEGIRVSEELEVGLLAHDRMVREGPARVPRGPDGLPRSELEASLYRQIGELRRIASTEAERERLDEVREDVDAYFSAQRDLARAEWEAGPALDAALNGLEQVIALNVERARAARSESERWNTIADFVGVVLCSSLLLGVLIVSALLRRVALQPLRDISQAMRRFGAGSKRTRAPEAGPTELRDMARTFNEMANSLSHQQEQQLAFLAGVAHELRNPLSALKLSTALSDRGRAQLTPERMDRTLALVGRQVERLDRMVGDLLDATRIEAGRLELRPEMRDARELAREVVELYRSGDTGHGLRLSLPDVPVPVRADPARLEQVLHNLISNALKYSPAGSTVEVAVRREQDTAVLCVTDQGIGISEEERRLLFAPFQRAGNARQRAPGVGLGLSVARRIVEGHGGSIDVVSQPGHGSVFCVRLAVAAEAARHSEEDAGLTSPQDTLH
ncbi:HAMP domain-containing histidine kinase [Myxococcus sp. AM009]|uniref:HAMP domain-containing sensor histidine kinase n=1 Tax=unclassified Myxococcus TaxID=2648731 RepID=UPI00159608E6|nr:MULTISPECIES: HAMP domain-containing sensor histidine kinase [unclassified Myxococcus]NVJ02781.1 HAMP domain-containing histidine kinase [Myxococcus sp. AM009]NVJ19319.1 HAMP domain-containing histidine kinase [Myxococcus sp. AM010]